MIPNIPVNARWAQNGVTVAGGHRWGSATNQLHNPRGLVVDDDQTVIVADRGNARIVQWKLNDTKGQVVAGGDKNGTIVAGGNGKGADLNQLNIPGYIFIDRQQTVCISDNDNHRVMKWNKGAQEGVVVAGGHGKGKALTQLVYPQGLFVDTLDTIYVTDSHNHRVMRWLKEAKEGTIIVGGNGEGVEANQFRYLQTVFNRAKELVSNLNILPSLNECNAGELNGLSKNISDSIRFNINSDNYLATDSDSSSDSESDYDDEAMGSNEFDSDLINVDEEDKDAAMTQNFDEIKTEKINFT
ncbi:unnamed protein product, partial [Rotaria sp. Silwood1]